MATGLDVVQKSVSGSSGCTDSWVEGQGGDRNGGRRLSSHPHLPHPLISFSGVCPWVFLAQGIRTSL